MSWYNGPYTVPEAGLIFVNNVTPDHPKRNTIVCVSQLSRPYVIAQDDLHVNATKIWILNYK